MKLLIFACSAVMLLAVDPAQELAQLAKKSPQSAAFREKLMALTKEPERKAGRDYYYFKWRYRVKY